MKFGNKHINGRIQPLAKTYEANEKLRKGRRGIKNISKARVWKEREREKGGRRRRGPGGHHLDAFSRFLRILTSSRFPLADERLLDRATRKRKKKTGRSTRVISQRGKVERNSPFVALSKFGVRYNTLCWPGGDSPLLPLSCPLAVYICCCCCFCCILSLEDYEIGKAVVAHRKKQWPIRLTKRQPSRLLPHRLRR